MFAEYCKSIADFGQRSILTNGQFYYIFGKTSAFKGVEMRKYNFWGLLLLLFLASSVYAQSSFQYKVFDARGQFLGYLVKTEGKNNAFPIRYITVYRPDINRFLILDTFTGELASEVKIWFQGVKCETMPYVNWSARYFVFKHTFGKNEVKYYTADLWPPIYISSRSLYPERKGECVRISTSTKLRLPAKEIQLPIHLPAATPFVFK